MKRCSFPTPPFSVLVDSDLPDGSSPEAQAAAKEAATGLLALPWELLHDGRSYLFQGQNAVRVCRRLPNRYVQTHAVTDLPIRILLISPRPENAQTSYIDHRISALPLVEDVESLGELVELTVLTPPTFTALQQALQRAAAAQQPFDVVHFDGHGVYNRIHGLGGLCFEDPRDSQKLHERDMAFVDAGEMAAVVREHRIPMVFLEACQSAQAEADPTASVAARRLEEGVTSVVGMSHSVLVETSRCFVQAFYAALAGGERVGQAMLAGQQVLYGDLYRGKIMEAGDLHLRDWFVPVLCQEEHDPQLITALLPQAVRQLQAQQRRLSLGALPEPPPHIDRLLERDDLHAADTVAQRLLELT
jgi:CHAT domain-containing protein